MQLCAVEFLTYLGKEIRDRSSEVICEYFRNSLSHFLSHIDNFIPCIILFSSCVEKEYTIKFSYNLNIKIN